MKNIDQAHLDPTYGAHHFEKVGRSVRGVHMLYESDDKSQRLAIHCHQMESSYHIDFGPELNFVRERLSALGLREEASVSNRENGYVVFVSPMSPFPSEEALAEGVWTLTEEGILALSDCLATVNDLLWRAYRDVTRPQLEAAVRLREAIFAAVEAPESADPDDAEIGGAEG